MKSPSDRPWVRRTLLLCAGVIFLLIGTRLFLSWWHPCVGKFLVVRKLPHVVPEDIARRIAENYPPEERQGIADSYKVRRFRFSYFKLVRHGPADSRMEEFDAPFEEDSEYEVVGEDNLIESLLLIGKGDVRVSVRVSGYVAPIWVDKFVGMEFRDRKGNRYFWQTGTWDTGIWCGRCQWYWLEKLK
ncbi:MAG: hypothetical protein HYU64_12185 [Armatimonadetes bacterium]|nr:hypothetical protein [Armatimonadota bacterium]